MQASPFCSVSKSPSHGKRGVLILQKGLTCTVKGAYLLRKRSFTSLFLLHTFAHICILRTLSAVYGCTPKTHGKTHGRFSGGFFASFERQKYANIVLQWGKFPWSSRAFTTFRLNAVSVRQIIDLLPNLQYFPSSRRS